MNILVVDDDAAFREAAGRVLGQQHYQVLMAASAEEALELLRSVPVALVICDERMPGRSGTDLLRALRLGGSHVPVVLVTAFGDRAQMAEALAGGAFDYLAKPVSAPHLLGVVRRALSCEDFSGRGS